MTRAAPGRGPALDAAEPIDEWVAADQRPKPRGAAADGGAFDRSDSRAAEAGTTADRPTADDAGPVDDGPAADDGPPDAGPGEEQAEEGSEALAEARAERDQYLEALQRLKADFDNYRKRSERERRTLTVSSTRDLVAELLPVMDNLERAVAALPEDGAGLAAGMEMVRAQLASVLAARGVAEIEALGEPFDPTVHEAVMSQPSADHEDGTVLEVVQKGYRHADAVLRPSRVVVAVATPA